MPKKKIEKIVIGSNNKGKIKEIRDLIPKKYRIFTPGQFKLKSPVENGKSFKENSLIKAKKFSLKGAKVFLNGRDQKFFKSAIEFIPDAQIIKGDLI